MTEPKTDLSVLAEQLNEQAQRLASNAHKAEHEIEFLEAKPTSRTALDPNFAENLRKSLAEPRQRLQAIAKSAK